MAKQARKLVLSNPGKAAQLYEQALKIDPRNGRWRASYALALERQGKVCAAYKQYSSATKYLKASAKERAVKSVLKYKARCDH